MYVDPIDQTKIPLKTDEINKMVQSGVSLIHCLKCGWLVVGGTNACPERGNKKLHIWVAE